jgi:hypothetical protein
MLVRAKPDPLPASPLAGRSAKSAELSAEQASTKRLPIIIDDNKKLI